MHQARLKINEVIASQISPDLFGSFVEHMGRCVYGGIFAPGDPLSDENGFRQDVIELTKEMGVTAVRYPGGNFVSGYRWEDGVGPKQQRPTRLDLAWRSIETNQFGLNEFMTWIEKIGAKPVMAVNLGTRGLEDAARLVEYTNTDFGTELSELRKEHGQQDTYGIRYWCLGNEMDGPWQVGHKTASDYGKLASDSAKAIRLVDPDVQLIVCGSSFEEMPTFGEWETTVLEHTFDHVDLISMHAYYEKFDDDSLSFLASSARMDRFINGVIERIDDVAKAKGSDKKVNISFDEWNVWYQKRFEGVDKLEFVEARKLIEDEYTVEDAVVVGSLLMTLVKHADRVKIACQAQLVNIIAPIRTEPGVPAWRQTIFYPFALTAAVAGHDLLTSELETTTKDSELFRDLPMTDSVVARDPETQDLRIFMLNRELSDETELQVDLKDLTSQYEVAEAVYLGGKNLGLTNNQENPERVSPEVLESVTMDSGKLSVILPPATWAMLRLTKLA